MGDTEIRINFIEAIKFFRECRDELSVRVRGGKFINPASGEVVIYRGIGCEQELQQLIQKSTNIKDSFIAVRDAEVYTNRVHEVLYDAKLIKTELKALIDNKSLIKDARYSEMSRDLKEVYSKVCDYHDIAEEKYKFLLEVMWGLVNINNSINKRFNTDPHFMFDYDS